MSAERDPITEAWDQVLEDWDDAVAHKRFIGLCAALDQLPEAGKRYRRARDEAKDEERRAQAEMHIDELFAVALSSLEALKTAPPDRAKSRIFWMAVGLALFMVGTMTWAVLRTR